MKPGMSASWFQSMTADDGPGVKKRNTLLQLGKGGWMTPRGGCAPREPPRSRKIFLSVDFDVFLLCFRAPPGSSRCRHWIGLVVAIRLHLTRALELNFKPRLGPTTWISINCYSIILLQNSTFKSLCPTPLRGKCCVRHAK